MEAMTREELQALPPAQLVELVLQLQHRQTTLQANGLALPPPADRACAPEQTETPADDAPPTFTAPANNSDEHYRNALHAQTRRAALLTQVAIELNEVLDVTTIVERVLRVTAATLGVTNVSIVLVHPNGMVEMANSIQQGVVRPMSPDLSTTTLEHSLASWVLRYDQSIVLSDIGRHPHWRALAYAQETGSAIAVPIKQARITRGILIVSHDQPHHFNSQDLLLLEGIVAQMSVALSASNRRVYESQRREHALTLLSTSQYLTAERSFTDLAAMIQDKSISVFDVDYGLLFLDEGEEGQMTPVMVPSGFEHMQNNTLIEQSTAAARSAWQVGSPVVSDAVAADGSGLNWVSLPLVHNGKTIGAIVLLRTAGGRPGFSANTWSLLTVFASFIASTCANMRLVAQLRNYTETLEGLVMQRARQLHHSRDTLRVVFDNVPDGLLLLNQQERLLAANHRFCEWFIGEHPRNIVGKWYSTIWEELARRYELFILQRELISQSHEATLKWIIHVQHQGQEYVYEVTRQPILENDTVVQYLERWQDVTTNRARHQASRPIA